MAKETRNGRKRSGNASADTEGNGGVAVAEETPFKYFVKGERPRADGAFFELLVIKVLEENSPLPDFDEVWPRGAQALAGLNTLRLSQFTAAELENIIGSVGGEFAARLHNRIADLLVWADAFWTIRQIYGSFRQYVRSFDTDGYEALIGDLSERLDGLSANLIVAYLRDAGEKIPNLPQIDTPDTSAGRPAKQQRPQRRQGRGSQGGRRRSGRGGNKANKKGERNGGSEQPTPEQQKPAKANQEKGASKNRRGRRGFFRRKRGAKPKTENAGTPGNSGNSGSA
jgi:hypothetical protein